MCRLQQLPQILHVAAAPLRAGVGGAAVVVRQWASYAAVCKRCPSRTVKFLVSTSNSAGCFVTNSRNSRCNPWNVRLLFGRGQVLQAHPAEHIDTLSTGVLG